MAVTNDIVRSWRRPRAVIRDLLAQGQREDRAIAYVLVACLLMFVAQWPRLVRVAEGYEAAPGPDTPELTQLVAYAFFGTVMVLPLVLYGLAALSHLVAKVLGGQGDWYSARLALFWALLAASPLALLYGLVRGFYRAGTRGVVDRSCLAGSVFWPSGFWVCAKQRDDRHDDRPGPDRAAIA